MPSPIRPDRPAAPRRTGLSPSLFLMMVALLAGCGGGGETVDGAPAEDAAASRPDGQRRDAERDDAGEPDAAPPETPTPDISPEPSSLTLLAPPGEMSAEGTLVLRNAGDAPLEVTALVVEPAGEGFSVELPTLPLVVAGGEQATVTLRYQAPDARPHAATLRISSNDPDEGRLTIPLAGRVAETCLEVMPRTLDIGPVELGQPSGRFELLVRNCGDVDARLTTVEVVDDPQFRIAAGDQDGPLSDVPLAAGSALRLDVWYVNDALTAGMSAMATLRIESDLEGESLIEVALRATGRESPQCRPVFEPGRLDFGALRIGTTRDLDLTVTNAGNTQCEFRSLEVVHEDGDPANAFALAPGSEALGTLDPGASRALTVRFAPMIRDQQGNRSVLQLVYTETGVDLNRREEVFLFGVAALAELGAVADAQRFADTQAPICASPQRTVAVQNIGLVPLCLTGWRQSGDDCPAFELLLAPEAADCVELSSGATQEFAFRFEPARNGAHTCDFIVAGDAMNVPEVVIALRGEGVDTADQTDVFEVGELDGRARAYFPLSRPADAVTVAVTVNDVANEAWRFSNDRNAVYFEPADHPDRGDEVSVRYEARCLPRE
ncbi:choice-of-anchor D domain-containing protein [Myxococcota bacterium]|nr:choice-of-anchor D domain-containing protein [Myxococcota bacterium]